MLHQKVVSLIPRTGSMPGPPPKANPTRSSSDCILVVEDDEDDVFCLKRTLKKAGLTNPLQIFSNGQKGLEYLAACQEPAARDRFPLPCLALLDLKVPYLDGFQVLTWIRARPLFDGMAIAMLTGSDEPRDRERVSSLGAQAYFVKPISVEDVARLYWECATPGFAAGARP